MYVYIIRFRILTLFRVESLPYSLSLAGNKIDIEIKMENLLGIACVKSQNSV